ncbi:MAG TPA: DoxX family membrane protein [Flavobacteriaceae bacterium]|nr:DoxX family membrane protein [Flavobacteriaceae bacterium]
MNATFTKILRVLLGVVLIIFGLNKLIPLNFLPSPEFSPEAEQFMNTLNASGYVLKTVGVIELFVGIFLIMRKWVAFALIILAPISLNILLFHVFMDRPGLILAILILVLNSVLIYKHWRNYKPLFY